MPSDEVIAEAPRVTARRRVVVHEMDLKLFEALHEGRFLTTRLITEEFFSHRNAANRRLKQLLGAGYIAKDQPSVTEDAIWRPTQKAVHALIDAGRLSREQATWTWKQSLSDITYKEHETDVNRLRLAFIRAADTTPNVIVNRCLSGPALHDAITDTDGIRYPVRPDRFLELSVEGTIFHYLIEVDRGTKDLKSATKRDVSSQLYAYNPYYFRGGFLRKYGRPGDPIQAWPFRVLVTVPTAARRNNVIERMITEMRSRNLPPGTMRAYALFDEVIADPFGAVWVREAELARILSWMENIPIDCPLGSAIPADRFPDVRDALGTTVEHAYRRSRTDEHGQRKSPIRDPNVRDRLVDALLRTGRIQRFSILERSWKAKERPAHR